MSATSSKNDAPRVIIFPPIIPLATIAAAGVLQWMYPLGVVRKIEPIHRVVFGVALAVAGILLLLSGARELLRHGTHVRPSLPAHTLVTSGVYAWTRNPFYVGGSIALIGVALALGLDWVPILCVISFTLLHFGIVAPEEKYLGSKFGDAFDRYKAAVPRYFWPF